MRGNREFSGVIGIILASVLKFIQDSPTNFRFPPGNVSAISPGQDEIYELIISHPSMVDSGRIVGNLSVCREITYVSFLVCQPTSLRWNQGD